MTTQEQEHSIKTFSEPNDGLMTQKKEDYSATFNSNAEQTDHVQIDINNNTDEGTSLEDDSDNKRKFGCGPRCLLCSCALIFLPVTVAVIVVMVLYYQPDKSLESLSEKYVSNTSQFIELPNGATMHFRDEGNPDGPVVVLIHGGFGSLHNWEGWTCSSDCVLTSQYRLISMDLLGHGLTGGYPDQTYTRTANRDAIHSLLQEIGVVPTKNYTVVGNSFGGGISIEIALAYPNEVEGVILVDSEGIPNGENGTYDTSLFNADDAVSPDDPEYTTLSRMERIGSKFISTPVIRSVLKQMVYDQTLLTDDFVNYFGEINRHEGNREAQILMFRQGLYQVQQNGPTDLLPRLGELASIPTLVMNGREDTLVPVHVAETFHNNIPNSELALIDEAGHLPMIEKPEQTAAVVQDFLMGRLPPAV